MDDHLPALFAALGDRCDRIDAAIAANNDPELQFARSAASPVVAGVRHRAAQLVGHPALAHPALHPFLLRQYMSLNLALLPIESYVLPVADRFSDPDRRLSKLLAELLAQANWTKWSPAVYVQSTDYYMAASPFKITFVPAGEDRRLLRLPDLCHEFGHCLVDEHPAELTGTIDADLSTWSANAQAASGAAHSPAFYDDTYELWASAWIEEFTCDAIGTFLCGVTYGQQHLGLCMGHLSTPFDEGETHPCDHARALVIERVLRKLGMGVDADACAAAWKGYCTASGVDLALASDPDFTDRYPHQFLDQIAQTTVDGLRQLGFSPFDPSKPAGPDNVAGLIAEAWVQFIANPPGYASWEHAQVAALYSHWGMSV